MEYDKNVKMTVTVEWMKKTYDELNAWLFNGSLGKCKFKVFTNGVGSQGRRLGFFRISKYYTYNSKTRRITGVDKYNFYDMCGPEIQLNGNYKGTEYAFASVLLHEMCHYYTYKDGVLPLQGHGIEFKQIAAKVGTKSGGYFKIQRCEREEVLRQLELCPSFVDKRSKRIDASINNAFCMLVFVSDGTVRLVKTTMEKVKKQVLDYEKKMKKCTKIVEINDINFTYECLRYGYLSNCRTYRFWPVQDKPFAQNYEKYNHKLLFVA